MPEEVPPIRDRLDLPRWLCQKGLTGEGVEVGVLFGEYSRHLLEYWPGTVHLIDPWQQQPTSQWLDGCNAVDMDRAYQKTLAAIEPYKDRTRIHRMFSLAAAAGFKDGQLDFVFCDGNHSYENVKAELNAYWPKIRSGGMLCGHDFYDRHDDWHDCGVETAVREFCAARGLSFYTTPCTSWWVERV